MHGDAGGACCWRRSRPRRSPGAAARELTDEDVPAGAGLAESKKRSEAAEIQTQNGRGELAAEEHAAARIIDEYPPTPLTEAEVADGDTAIAQVAEEIGERPSTAQMGLVDEGRLPRSPQAGRRRIAVRGGARPVVRAAGLLNGLCAVGPWADPVVQGRRLANCGAPR